jgi:hypothetical protein
MKQLLTLASILVATVLVLSLVAPAPVALAGDEGDMMMDGKALFEQHKCNLCHSVSAVEIESKTSSDKMKGPDLSGFELDDMTFEDVAAFLRKSTELDGAKHKREFKGTDEELKTILDWLGSLEAMESM